MRVRRTPHAVRSPGTRDVEEAARPRPDAPLEVPIRHAPSRPLALALAVAVLAACASGGEDDAPPAEVAQDVAPVEDDAPPEPEPEEDEPEDAGPDPADLAAEVGADELGEIPVLMYHRLREDGGGDFDTTAEEFEQELRDLHDEGYRFITTAELVSGEIDVPAGTTPAVLTFDDSTREQFALTEDGEVDPDTSVGIMLALAEELDDFRATGSFYVLGSLFGSTTERGAQLLAELHELGFEVGNHTRDHDNLAQLDDAGVQRALADGQRNILEAVPDAQVTTLSLPFGINPQDRALLGAGSHDGFDYTHDAALLVGSGPSPSPFHADFEPLAIPRIRSQPAWSPGDEVDFGSGYWRHVLRESPERRYVSDGDPTTVAVPSARAEEVADHVDPDRVVTY